MSILVPNPRDDDRVVRRPDGRELLLPARNAATLGDEVDYDELSIKDSWLDPEVDSDNVRYFMYELFQKDPGQKSFVHFFKAARFLRVTRVPRYVREGAGDGPTEVYSAQRKLLSALRENHVLFTQIVASSPDLPLVFAWGVQATGATKELAQQKADMAYEILEGLVDSVYSQLEYAPISWEEANHLATYQRLWTNLAVGRGRPSPAGKNFGVETLTDGARTDVDTSNEQMETFIRGMGNRSFMLTLLTSPIHPRDMSKAWRNLSQRVSRVASDVYGTRSFTAAVALPFGLNNSAGSSIGTGHTAGVGTGTTHTASSTDGTNQGTSTSHQLGINQSVSDSNTLGTSHSVGNTDGTSNSNSTNESQTQGTALGQTNGVTDGQSVTDTAGQSYTHGVNASDTTGTSHTDGASVSDATTQSVGHDTSTSLSDGVSRTIGTNTNVSVGGNTSNSETLGLNGSQGSSLGDAFGTNQQNNVNAMLGGAGSSTGLGSNNSFNRQLSSGFGSSDGVTVSGGNSLGLTGGTSDSLGATVSASTSAGDSVGLAHSQALSVSTADTTSDSHTAGTSDALGVSNSQAVGNSTAQSTALSATNSAAQQVGVGQTAGTSQATSVTDGTSAASTHGTSAGNSESWGTGTSQGTSTATGTSDSGAYSNADSMSTQLARTSALTSSLGVVPSVGISTSRQTVDKAKESLRDTLDAQLKRYNAGVGAGAWFYQMSLTTPDEATLARGVASLKAGFWGQGNDGTVSPEPFQVTPAEVIRQKLGQDEVDRLLAHVSVMSTYRKREVQREIIAPYAFTSYLTHDEGAAFTHPPTVDALGLIANADSIPQFRLPYIPKDKDLYLGHLISGATGRVLPKRYSMSLDKIKHALVVGQTGSGKTTGLLRLITDALHTSRTVQVMDPETYQSTSKVVRPSVLALDWKDDWRNLASTLSEEDLRDRFRFFSVAKPQLGKFRFNLLALPHMNVNPSDWAGSMADLFMITNGLGEFGRSIVFEGLLTLYSMNRLKPQILRPAFVEEETDRVIRPAEYLPAVNRGDLPADAIQPDENGEDVANCYTHPELTRLVSMQHLATWVSAQVEYAATPEGGRLYGTAMRDRLQSVWRRISSMAPGGPWAHLFEHDSDLNSHESLTVMDLADPEVGPITVVEAEGLSYDIRGFVLGGVLLSVWKWGQQVGKNAYDPTGSGMGLVIVMEEAQELAGDRRDDDRDTSRARSAMFDSMFRMSRTYGIRLVPVAQNISEMSKAVTSQCSTVVSFRQSDQADKDVLTALFNWTAAIGGHFNEIRYLGRMQQGNCLVKEDPLESFLESDPIHVRVDPTGAEDITDDYLLELESYRQDQLG